MVLDLVTNPDGFFERRADDPGWLGPVAVVFLVGLVSALAQIPLYQAILGSLPESAGIIVVIIQVFGAVFTLIISFVTWLIVGVLLYVTANVAFGSEGELWTVVKLAGWGFVPNLLGAVISGIIYFTVFSGVQFPNDPQQTQQLAMQLQNRPEFLLSTVAGVVLLVWSGLLWTFAVQYGLGLSFRDAVKTAAVPVGLLLLLQVGALVLSGFGGGL